ncbi:MAG: PilZ domain-containing protein [Bryobacteraceae bacterium]
MVADRRHTQRYALNLPIHYCFGVRTRTTRAGFGVTRDISARGVRFTTQEAPVPKGPIALHIVWPVASEGASLELRALGRVVRVDAAGIAVRFTRQELTRSFTESRDIETPPSN